MAFPKSVEAQALAACNRRCCICHKFCGVKMELHHIKQKADGGEDSFENCIPLCFDCHGDMGKGDPHHPKGKRYSEKELILHRDNWYAACKIKDNSGLVKAELEQCLDANTATIEEVEAALERAVPCVSCGESEAVLQTVYFNSGIPFAANIKNKAASYSCDEICGKFTFDYSNNNGEYTIGKGLYQFVTKWSKASNTSIHAYKDGHGIDAIARVKNIKQLPFELIGEYDFSSRVRTPNIGDMIIWKNNNGKYAATRIVSIADDTRGADHDELTCEYLIYTSKKYVDSDWVEEQLKQI